MPAMVPARMFESDTARDQTNRFVNPEFRAVHMLPSSVDRNTTLPSVPVRKPVPPESLGRIS